MSHLKEALIRKIAADDLFDNLRNNAEAKGIEMAQPVLEEKRRQEEDIAEDSAVGAVLGGAGGAAVGGGIGGLTGAALVWALMKNPKLKDYALGGLSGAAVGAAPAAAIGAGLGAAIPGMKAAGRTRDAIRTNEDRLMQLRQHEFFNKTNK